MERLQPSTELLRELDPGHQAVRQIATEKIKAYINGTRVAPLVAEVVHIPGETVEPDEFKGESK